MSQNSRGVGSHLLEFPFGRVWEIAMSSIPFREVEPLMRVSDNRAMEFPNVLR